MNIRSILVVLSTALSLFGQYWINAGKTSLKTTAEVAGREEVRNYALPPDYAFGIWGVIYLGFVLYAVYGLTSKGARDPFFKSTAVLVAVSIVLNFLWTFIVGLDLWTMAFFLQWIMMVLSLLLLLRWKLHVSPLSFSQRFLSIPFALYAGWLTVAMIPFTADLLNKTGWDYRPFDPQTWAIIIYILACMIVVLAYRRLKQPFYLLPVVWALAGYAVRFDGTLRVVSIVLAALMVVYFFIEAFRFYKTRGQ
jgi:hypothetical protein